MFADRMDVHFDRGGKVFFVMKYVEDLEEDDVECDDEELSLGVRDPTKEWTRHYKKVVEYDSDGDEMPDGDFSDSEPGDLEDRAFSTEDAKKQAPEGKNPVSDSR